MSKEGLTCADWFGNILIVDARRQDSAPSSSGLHRPSRRRHRFKSAGGKDVDVAQMGERERHSRGQGSISSPPLVIAVEQSGTVGLITRRLPAESAPQPFLDKSWGRRSSVLEHGSYPWRHRFESSRRYHIPTSQPVEHPTLIGVSRVESLVGTQRAPS